METASSRVVDPAHRHAAVSRCGHRISRYGHRFLDVDTASMRFLDVEIPGREWGF